MCQPSIIMLNTTQPNSGRAALFEFLRNTPSNTRIACHPYDGDDVPFRSGRPTTGEYETLQPWFVESWRRHKELIKEVLTALYAADLKALIAFYRKERITHLLLNTDRYGLITHHSLLITQY